jgi:malonyl-CoA O-methyltransferase
VARARFERSAHSYASASRLEEEVGARMLERLDYLRIAPRRILDAGSGPWRHSEALRNRYAGAEVIALDYSLRMLQIGRSDKPFWKKRAAAPVCGDFMRLPLATGSLQFVWSNMALHWASDPLAAFKESARVLAPEGLLMFSTLGPDSLKELRVAAGTSRVHPFIDMHDLGDMLVAAGMSAPVMDMEMLTFTYEDPETLLADLRGGGQTNARTDRRRGLSGKGFGRRLRESLAGRAGVVFGATYEVVYGHAWKGAARKLQDGRDIVQFRAPSLR